MDALEYDTTSQNIKNLEIIPDAYDDTILNLNWHKSPIRTGNLGALFENVEDNGQFAIMNYTTSTTKRDYGFSGNLSSIILFISCS